MYLAVALLVIIALLVIQFFVFGPRQFRNRAKFVTDYAVKRGYRLVNPDIAQISGNSSAKDILTNPSWKSFVKAQKELPISKAWKELPTNRLASPAIYG